MRGCYVAGKFEGRAALVTAGASGIGEAVASAFVAEGAAVLIADIDEDRGEKVIEDLKAKAAQCRFVHADATVEEDVERLVRYTVESFGDLSLAANLVGGVLGGANGPELHLKSVEGWDATVALCLRSTFLGLKHEITHMIDHGGGSIVNVSSLGGISYVPECGGAYSAAKAGVIQLTKVAAVNYGDRNIRVNCISPGATITPAYFVRGDEAGHAQLGRMVERQAIKRVIEPGEQAAVVVWLCSDDAVMVTGHNVPIDGGWSAY